MDLPKIHFPDDKTIIQRGKNRIALTPQEVISLLPDLDRMIARAVTDECHPGLYIAGGTQRWTVDSSHLFNPPPHLDCTDLQDLRRQVQAIADEHSANRSSRQLAFGKLEFRYEADDEDVITVVHAYFVNKLGQRQRYMRLRWRDE
jgi:hypothetical protein